MRTYYVAIEQEIIKRKTIIVEADSKQEAYEAARNTLTLSSSHEIRELMNGADSIQRPPDINDSGGALSDFEAEYAVRDGMLEKV